MTMAMMADESILTTIDGEETPPPPSTTTGKRRRIIFIIIFAFLLALVGCTVALYSFLSKGSNNNNNENKSSAQASTELDGSTIVNNDNTSLTPPPTTPFPTRSPTTNFTTQSPTTSALRTMQTPSLRPALSPTAIAPIAMASSSPSRAPTLLPTSSPTIASLANPTVTMAPTLAEVYVPPNPIPDFPIRSYFNYDLNNPMYGPINWPNIDMRGTYLSEFGQPESGQPTSIWNNHMTTAVSDVTRNRCYREGHQSPVNLIQTSGDDAVCRAVHQIRWRHGGLELTSDLIEKRIESNKLRILLNRRPCVQYDQAECKVGRPPIADFPNYSSNITHLSDLLHLDLKVPGEHTLEGQFFDAEIQMLHIHLTEPRLAMAGIPIRATPTGYNEKFQHVLDQFQIVYTNHQTECNAKQQQRRLGIFGRLLLRPKQQSSPLDDPEFRRRVQGQSRVLFDPFGDFMETFFFYRYDGTTTEPPCFPITWFVLDQPTTIATSQLRQLKHLLFTHVDGNCQTTSVHNQNQSVVRPIQPLGIVRTTNKPREVMHCKEGDFEPDPPMTEEEVALLGFGTL